MKNLFLALFAPLLILAACGHGIDYSDGDRIGTIQTFALAGMACKTWEGEMAMQGWHPTYSSDSKGNTIQTGMSNIFKFTVEDPAVVKKVQKSMASGNLVDLQYSRHMFSSPCTSSSGYFITGVRTPAEVGNVAAAQ